MSMNVWVRVVLKGTEHYLTDVDGVLSLVCRNWLVS